MGTELGGSGGLSDAEIRGLVEALDDEYLAHATYEQVLADFGEDALPFANIVEAEARHIGALLRVFSHHGLPVPDNPWPGRVPRFESVADACRAGVDAEVANAALYDRLLTTTERPEMLEVYRNLQRASQENHLPAFRRCAERSAGGRGGEGGRQARRRGGRG